MAAKGDASDGSIGIDELARQCDTTVRTIREYQTFGVLPAPRKAGRVAVYDHTHITRLRTIARLQERGYSLAAIADLLAAWETGTTLPAVLGVTDEPLIGAIDEAPVIVRASDLAAEIPSIFAKASLTRRARKVGLVAPVDDTRFRVRSPALVQFVAAMIEAGIPASAALDIVEAIDTRSADVASTMVDTITRSRQRPARRGADATTDDADDALVVLMRRGRGLVAQAIASTLIRHLGDELDRAAIDDPRLTALLDGLRVGDVRDTTR